MKRNNIAWLRLLIGLCLSPCIASAMDAESAFQSVGPGVVLIKDLEGFGSGVVLTPDGLIVTCQHVVNTPMKQTVVAEVMKLGQRSKQEFQDVKIVGVHPTYDLALIQVKAPTGVSFIVPPKAPPRPLSTGEDCYVIGNPSGAAGKILENSISKGIIGTADRIVENQHFIQVTAQINPGNSGGALCDKNGQVVGIVTFKIGEAEGLGFAIPIATIRKTDFVAATEKKGNKEKSIKFEEAGAHWFDVARRTTGQTHDAALYLAYVSYRLALAEMPNEPGPYHNVGAMYYEMNEFETARVFYEKAVELAPDFPTSHQMLGMIAIKQKDMTRADKHFLAGIQTKQTDERQISAQAACIQNYGVGLIEKQRYAEGAYLAKWSMSLRNDMSQHATLNKMFQQGCEKLTDSQFVELSGKQNGFSLEDMKRFTQGKNSVANSAPKSPKSVADSPAITPTSTSTLATTANLSLAKLFEKMMTGAPKPEPTGLKKALPEAPKDIRPAMGGAYLVMDFPVMGKLGVFNVAQAKFETYFPVPENYIYTAGGTTLLVYLPKDRIFQIYDMRMLQRTGAKPSRIIGELTDIEMGLFNSQFALISYADDSAVLAKRHYAILNLDSFQTIEIIDNNFTRNRCYRDNIHMRVDENFTSVSSWATSHSPSGFIFARLSTRGVTSATYEHNSFGSLLPDRLGQRIYSTGGKILGLKGEPLKEFASASLFPVRGGDYFMEVRKKQVTVRESVGNSEIRHFELPFEYANTQWTKDKLTDDRLVHGCAQLDRACFVDMKGLALYEFELGLGADTQQIRQSLEGVKRGTLWIRKMNFPAGTKVNVEDAPIGVKYEVATSTLSWPIPATQSAGSVTILLSVTLPGKDEGYQRVVVPIQ